MKRIHTIPPKRSIITQKFNYKDKKIKQQLAQDFHMSCGYCGDSHYFVGGINNFHIDHFAPKSLFKELENNYQNLVYSCPYCNCSKSNKWVGHTAEEAIIGNKGFIDPCDAIYSEHLYREEDGSIMYKTDLGKYIYNELKLYLFRHKILYQLNKLRSTINRLKEKQPSAKNPEKIFQMYCILCTAYFEYHDLYCKGLDNFEKN